MKDVNMVCTTCGFVGKPNKRRAGSTVLELFLWCFLAIPGIFYTLWRFANKQLYCPRCNHNTIIPSDTPNGKRIIEQGGIKIASVDK